MNRTLNAIVTGGSSGIGQATCRHLLESGATVVNIDVNPPQQPEDEHYRYIRADLTDPEQTRAAAARATQEFEVNCLVNNAGASLPADLPEVTDADFDRGVNLHLRTPVILAQACTPAMRSAGFGRIVNIASRVILGKKSRTVYSSTKSGLVGLTRSWALELAAEGITVNAISPGPVLTELFLRNNPPDVAKRLIESAIVGRAGTPDDIARAVLFFAAPENGYVTGQVLHVCGGSSLGSATW